MYNSWPAQTSFLFVCCSCIDQQLGVSLRRHTPDWETKKENEKPTLKNEKTIGNNLSRGAQQHTHTHIHTRVCVWVRVCGARYLIVYKKSCTFFVALSLQYICSPRRKLSSLFGLGFVCVYFGLTVYVWVYICLSLSGWFVLSLFS